MNANKINCYCEILQGSALIAMFVAIVMMMYDMIPEIPLIVNSQPAPIMKYLAPISQGDMLIIMLITCYGAIWGIRLITSALYTLRELKSVEVMIKPTTQNSYSVLRLRVGLPSISRSMV